MNVDQCKCNFFQLAIGQLIFSSGVSSPTKIIKRFGRQQMPELKTLLILLLVFLVQVTEGSIIRTVHVNPDNSWTMAWDMALAGDGSIAPVLATVSSLPGWANVKVLGDPGWCEKNPAADCFTTCEPCEYSCSKNGNRLPAAGELYPDNTGACLNYSKSFRDFGRSSWPYVFQRSDYPTALRPAHSQGGRIVVGYFGSDDMNFLGPFLVGTDMITIGGYATATSVTSKSQSNINTFRTVPHDGTMSLRIVQTLASFGWRRAAFFYKNAAWGNGMAFNLRSASAELMGTYNITWPVMVSHLCDADSFAEAASAIRASGVNIIVSMADCGEAFVPLTLKEQGLLGGNMVHVRMETLPSALYLTNFGRDPICSSTCTSAETQAAYADWLSGMLTVVVDPASAGYDAFMAHPWVQNGMFGQTSLWPYQFDANVAAIVAAATVSDPNNISALRATVHNLDFEGASGRVTFDEKRDRTGTSANFRIMSAIVDRDAVTVTNVEVAKVTGSGFSTAGMPAIIWPDGSSETPIDQTTIPEEPEDYTPIFIGLGIASGLFVLVLFVGTAVFIIRRVLLFRRLRRRRDRDLERQVSDAISVTRGFSYPAVFVRATDFVTLGKLTSHEELRERGLLVTRDALDRLTTSERLVFFSHQWTGWSTPDPSNRQYEVMCAGLQATIERERWSAKSVLVWVDFSSIPQVCKSVQTLAINSLAAYAAHADVFLIVAPAVKHADHGGVCDYESYQKRMWCRAEQLCHALRNSTENMYISSGLSGEDACKKLASSATWVSDNLHVFEGECTIEADRLKIVPSLLGLYAEAIANSEHATSAAVLSDISKDKERVFPESIEIEGGVGVRTGKKATYELFGSSIQKLEQMLERDEELRMSLRRPGTGAPPKTSPPAKNGKPSATMGAASLGFGARVAPFAVEDADP